MRKISKTFTIHLYDIKVMNAQTLEIVSESQYEGLEPPVAKEGEYLSVNENSNYPVTYEMDYSEFIKHAKISDKPEKNAVNRTVECARYLSVEKSTKKTDEVTVIFGNEKNVFKPDFDYFEMCKIKDVNVYMSNEKFIRKAKKKEEK